jgi:toxin ParE1/3/4
VSRYRLRPAAARELRSYTDHLRIDAGTDTALRFVAMARKSFGMLADTPGIGAPVQNRNPRLSGLRKWHVEGFPKLLIFYVPQASGIHVLHIVHAARDWWSLFDMG